MLQQLLINKVQLCYFIFYSEFIVWMINSVESDRLASEEGSGSGSTLFSRVGIDIFKRYVQSALIVSNMVA